jgi:phosphoglycerol transferase
MAKKKRNKSGNPAAGSAQTIAEVRPAAPIAQSTYSVAGSSALPSTSFVSSRYFEWLVLAVASAISYWILTVRLVKVSVSVLIDEYSYVLDAHYREFSETRYPNHLFQLVFSATKTCGEDFYGCARGFNAIFVVGSAIVLYFFAKYVSGKKYLGAAAALAGLLGSLGTYTAYFMPEAIFNFFMLLFFYGLIRYGNSRHILVWIGLGVSLGVASLAKPHAFFVVPALIIFIFLWSRAANSNFLLIFAIRVTVFLSSLVGSKYLLGYLIAGEKGLSIFGLYGTVESATGLAATTLVQNSGLDVIGTSWGQTMMMTMVLGVSLPVAILGLLSSFSKDQMIFEANRVRALVGISLLNMMAVTALFEAWMGLFIWMHTRYYSYLIPLLVIALIEAYRQSQVRVNRKLKIGVVGIYLVLAAVALVTAGIPYGANWIDAPDFRTHIDNPVLSSVFIVLSIGLAIAWIWETKKVMALAIAITVASFIFSGSYISTFLKNSFGNDSSFDHLGRVLSDYLPQEELDRTVLVGDNNTTMERALFSARTGSATAVLAPATGFDIAELDPTVMWVVKVGEPVVTGLGAATISGPGYSIHNLYDPASFAPRSDDKVGVSNQCETSDNERWSCGPSATVNYDFVKGNGTAIDILLEVSETAAQGEIEFVLGQTVLTGQLPSGVYALALDFPLEPVGGELIVRAGAGSPSSSAATEKFVKVLSINTR